MTDIANNIPKYLPHMQHKDTISMGMEPLNRRNWIEPDELYLRFLEHKLALKALQQQHIFDALPSSIEAQQELAFELKRHLLGQHSHLYCAVADGLSYLPNGIDLAQTQTQTQTNSNPLWQASLWVADDLLIMQKLDDEYCLTAASLCSPSHWHLAQKIGQSMAKIHDPVPTIHQKLTPKIDRFFDYLTVENPVQRFNWSLQANAQLAQFPEDKVIHAAHTPLYYRCERQTLTRLPQTNAIAFTIRVYVYPMMSLTQVPNALTQLKSAINAMPKSVAKYKEIIYFSPALLKYFSDLSSLEG
tara:strand:+ start:821 stop:1723 length:903 start_codon:yes stop_codon:yes gene_type:complete